MNDSYQIMLESLSQLNRNVSLSLPAFWEKEPIAWFKCLDVVFTSQRIYKQSKMFNHVLKRLPPKYLAPLSDVITECSQSINQSINQSIYLFVLCFKTKNTPIYVKKKKFSKAQEGSEMTIRSSSQLPPPK